MKKGTKFSPERLHLIRRMRRARRYHKQVPLFAYEQMRSEYPGYTHAEFLEDLRRRTPKKKRVKKSHMMKYGRYWRMQKLLSEYRETGDVELARQATKLRQYMSKPYRVLVRVAGYGIEFSLSPLIQIERVEALLTLLSGCKAVKEAEDMISEFMKGDGYGN